MSRGGRLIIATENRCLDDDYAAAHPDVTPGDLVMIEVSDTGDDMTPETMSQIFEPFFTTKEPGKGYWAGAQHGVRVSQAVGRACERLQRGRRRYDVPPLPAGLSVEGELRETADLSGLVRGAGKTVLFVEDNPGMRRVVLRQLRELGYQPLECDRASAALDVLRRERVDLLLTDIVMAGGLDGFELARIARDRWPSLEIVLTSGFPQARVDGDNDKVSTMRLLSKPYREEELAAILREALDG